jgi:hypothetical protein
VSTNELAITLAVLGGISEVVGVLTVVREIAEDRARAKELFSTPREYVPPERRYPARLGRHSFGVGGFGGQGAVASIMRPKIEDQITDLAASAGNAMLDMQKSIYEDRDELEKGLLGEIDKGYNQVRADLKDVLEGDTKLRLVGVGALLLGVVLSAAGSILGNLG